MLLSTPQSLPLTTTTLRHKEGLVVIDTDVIVKNWRTTVTGLLNAAIACIVAVSVLPPHLAKTVYALAVLHALVGFLSKDAPPTP